VTVVRISGGGVRIGVEAPKELPVVREELKLKMDQKEKESAECDDQSAFPAIFGLREFDA